MEKRRGGKPHNWTEKEESYIRENFPTQPTCDIAVALGISDNTVIKKAKEMGVEKDPSYSKRNFQNRWVRTYRHSITKYR